MLFQVLRRDRTALTEHSNFSPPVGKCQPRVPHWADRANPPSQLMASSSPGRRLRGFPYGCRHRVPARQPAKAQRTHRLPSATPAAPAPTPAPRPGPASGERAPGHLSSPAVMTPSSLGMRSAALTASWCPSTLLSRTGRRLCGRE